MAWLSIGSTAVPSKTVLPRQRSGPNGMAAVRGSVEIEHEIVVVVVALIRVKIPTSR